MDVVMPVYERASIPAMDMQNAKVKMNKLLDRYNKLQKSKNHMTDRVQMSCDIFLSDIKEIFDNACESKPILPEDEAFFASQKEDRVSSSISGQDAWFKKMLEKLKRIAKE